MTDDDKIARAIAVLPEMPRPFSDAQRAEVLDTIIDDVLPPRAAAKVREHLLHGSVKYGIPPGTSAPGRSPADHMAGSDRHLLRMARLDGPGYDLGAVDADSGALHLVASICRQLLALEGHLIERERAEEAGRG